MEIFPSNKSRVLLVCIGFIILFIMIFYLLQNERYKSAQLIYRCYSTGGTRAILGLFKPIDFSVDFFGLVYEGRSGNSYDNTILCFGAQEKYILYFMRDIAALLEKDEVVFIDVGANVGQHSLFMSRLVKEVHAFEPYPPVLERFRKLVAINHINNIHIHPVGLGNENGQIPFFEPPGPELGTGSFIDRGLSKNKIDALPIVIGDEWLKEHGTTRADIIKCDIEGYEKLALLGLKHILERNRPIIVMELNLGTDESFQSIDDFYATFPLNYEFLFFCKEDLYTGHYDLCPYDGRLNFAEKRGYNNIVVYPKEKKRLIMKAYTQNG